MHRSSCNLQVQLQQQYRSAFQPGGHLGINPSWRRQRNCTEKCRSFLQSLLAGVTGDDKTNLSNCEPQLSEWLEARGLAVSQLKVVPQLLEGQGRGLVASRTIRQGEQLLAVPLDLVLFPPTAAAESVLAPLLPQDVDKLPDWTLLVLYLAEQCYYLNRGLPLPSPTWAPYLNSLPRPPVGTVLDWSAEEVSKLLSGSGLLVKAQAILAAAEALRRDIQVVISTAKQQGLCPADMFTLADINWAIGICLSRSVRLDDRGGVVVLCPFADLFNHSCTSTALLTWDTQQQAVVLKADKSYKPGEEVYISYGAKSSGELLLSYGFCPAPGSNPYDAAYLSFGLEITDPLMQEKKQELTARGLPTQECFGVLIDALPDGLLAYAAFCAARPKKAADVQQLAQQLFNQGGFPDIDGVSSELVGLEAVVKQCKAAAPGYKQSAAADKQLAAQVQTGGGFAQRAAVMAAVRLREQQILSRTEFVLSQRIRELKRAGRRML